MAYGESLVAGGNQRRPNVGALGLKERASRYLNKVPGAVSGSGGHNATMATACNLVRNFGSGLKYSEMWELLLTWNETCDPPWTTRDLEHKFNDAVKQVSPNTIVDRPISREEMSDKSSLAKKPPKLDVGSEAQLMTLSNLRNIPVTALQRASKIGTLKFGRKGSAPSWWICNRNELAFEARRLDGEEYTLIGAKSWRVTMIEGASRHGIGLHTLPMEWSNDSDDDRVVIVEGGADYLAALHLFPLNPVICYLGAWIIIPDEDLYLLSDRDIIIISDRDEAGREAFYRWGSQLLKAGASSVVDGWKKFPLSSYEDDGDGDLNDYVASTLVLTSIDL